jgi:simple sugar transport system substrate-binding protein
VAVSYQAPTSFDMVRMSSLIDAAVAARPAGLIVSVPDADALAASIRAATEAGIPAISINSGDDAWQRLGLLAHIGQTEFEAGQGGGERLAQAGARRVLCVNHEVGNAALDVRCDGLAAALTAAGGTVHVIAVDLADPDDAQQRIAGALAADPAIDGMLTLGPAGAGPALAALRETGGSGRVRFAAFDLAPEVLAAVRDGNILFAIDQQPYLQGYLAVVLLTKYLETAAMPGGGQVIRTGPGFVTAEDAARVIELTERGIR